MMSFCHNTEHKLLYSLYHTIDKYVMKPASFAQCIKRLNPTHLKQICETYGIVTIPFASESARKHILSQSESKSFFDDIFAQLQTEHKRILMLINLFSEYIHVEPLHRFLSFLYPEIYSDVVESLLHTGLLFHVQPQYASATYYLIPAEAASRIDEITHSELNNLVPLYHTAPGSVHAEHGSFILGVYTVLIAALKDDLRLNMDETLNKRSLNKIRHFLGVVPESLGEETLTEYSNFIVSYVTAIDLISLQETDSGFNISQINTWIELPFHEKCISILNFIVNVYDQEYSWRAFMHILSKLKPDIFYDISALEQLYSIFFSKPDTTISDFTRHPLSFFPIFMLNQLDIIEIGSSDLNTFCAWKISAAGMELLQGKLVKKEQHEYDNTIIVQPNFELIVSRNADPALIWNLCLFADMIQSDYRMRFHLTRQSVHLGLSQDIPQEKIISLIVDNSAQEIPQNVMYSLTEWCQEFGAAYFIDVFLLRCKAAQLADQLSMHPKTKDYIKGRFSDTDLIVNREDYQELFDILHALDLMPLRTIERPDEIKSETTTTFSIIEQFTLKSKQLHKTIEQNQAKFISGLIP